MNDKYWMTEAYKLSLKGKGFVAPNPIVGCIIVKNNNMISSGYHQQYGKGHAEANAISSCQEAIGGSTMYVTLEPCNHYGQTPPCTRLIIDNDIKRVVIGMKDPNPRVNGSGAQELINNGIEVDWCFLDEIKESNRIFIKNIIDQKTYVMNKIAMTLDGKTATKTKESKWITCEDSRRIVHNMRQEYDAVLVGLNTVIEDNPKLTVRHRYEKKSNPHVVILDSQLNTSIDAKLFHQDVSRKIYVAVDENIQFNKIKKFLEAGVRIIKCPTFNGLIDLNYLLETLFNLGIYSLLVEGGATVHESFINNYLTDELNVFISPKVFGGKNALGAVDGTGISRVADAIHINDLKVKKVGSDFMFTGYINDVGGKNVYRNS